MTVTTDRRRCRPAAPAPSPRASATSTGCAPPAASTSPSPPTAWTPRPGRDLARLGPGGRRGPGALGGRRPDIPWTGRCGPCRTS
ncbi:hypothetical protein NKH77_15020 [Streptomyces sp. M19]